MLNTQKLTRKALGQIREAKFIILTSLQSFNLSFPRYSMLFLPLYLSFHLDSLQRHSDSQHFLYFHLDFPHFHADSLHPHSHPISHIPTLSLHISVSTFPSPHFPHSVLQFPILALTNSLLSFYSLRSYFRKIVALAQKRTLPFFTTA